MTFRSSEKESRRFVDPPVDFSGPTEAGTATPQSCNPAVVSYLVRDEQGSPLDETDLKTISGQLPASDEGTRPFVGEVSFANDGRSFYRPESIEAPSGKMVSMLQLINAETCTMHLSEVTLSYHHKTMRLVFNIDIARNQADRRLVIDSLPFQEGSFELSLSGWSHPINEMIPATRWKPVTEGRRSKDLSEHLALTQPNSH
jgi:hypothetical protein